MGYRFEFDPVNRILLARMEGELTDDVAKEADLAIRQRVLLTRPRVFVVDCSAVTNFAMSSERVRDQASKQEPAIPGLHYRRFFVAPSTVGFGMARMFQIAGETTHPEIAIARSLGEVFDVLGLEPPQFEPLE